MLDTHAIARSLTGSGLSEAQADAITAAVRQAADAPSEMATKADLHAMRADIYRAMLIQAGAIVGAVVAILRTLG